MSGATVRAESHGRSNATGEKKKMLGLRAGGLRAQLSQPGFHKRTPPFVPVRLAALAAGREEVGPGVVMGRDAETAPPAGSSGREGTAHLFCKRHLLIGNPTQPERNRPTDCVLLIYPVLPSVRPVSDSSASLPPPPPSSSSARPFSLLFLAPSSQSLSFLTDITSAWTWTHSSNTVFCFTQPTPPTRQPHIIEGSER